MTDKEIARIAFRELQNYIKGWRLEGNVDLRLFANQIQELRNWTDAQFNGDTGLPNNYTGGTDFLATKS